MKKRIRISESQLGAIVRDAVNEMFRDGEGYDTVLAAADKMERMGQYKRASRLKRKYSEMNDTDDIIYNNGRVIRIPMPGSVGEYVYQPDTDTLFNNEFNQTTDTDRLRLPDKRRAREIADRIKKLNPNSKFADKNLFIAEAVRKVLSEMFRDGENYPLANATVDKMLAKGQWGRANDLMKNYKAVNDTEDVIYDYDLVTVSSPDGSKEAYYDNVRDRMFPTKPDKEDPNDVSFLRSTDRKRARRIADRIKKINPRTGIDKNNFIYEAVREKIKKMLG